ncbi:MAG: hypothetical protein RIC52_18845 [Amphiplicatus sp.]
MQLPLFAAIAAFVATGALAQTPALSGDPPCAGDIHRAFDFWIGKWDVFVPDGTKAGENIIASEENGCLLVERWKGAGGSTGQSYNFYDHAQKKWRQVWISPGTTIDYAGGLNAAGEMVLEGTIGYSGGTTAPFRGTWTKLGGGDVRQHFQQYNAETETWDDWFVGIYRKKAQ